MPGIKKRFTACRDGAQATVERFYEYKNATETTVDLYFYGDIVSDWWGAWQEEDQYPEAIKNFLAEANGRDLNIYINSGGGSVFAGIAIYNMLKRYQGKKTVHVDALAGSIASVIAFADSDMPTIPSNAYLMIHKPWAGWEGTETWPNGTQAAEYFRVKVGEENTIAAAVQDYTKLYCHNTPREILKPESAAGQQDTGEQDRRKEIVSLAMEYMTR